MHVLLSQEEQNQPAPYPPWCNLSWFYNCRGISGDVELHYHDAAEIWLWHEGTGESVVDGQDIPLRPGTMVYTPAGCQHSYQTTGKHSNTGIVPRKEDWMRTGHLHVLETGESPTPEMASFHFPSEANQPGNPVRSPTGAFLSSAFHGTFDAGENIMRTTTSGWTAILVREGILEAIVDETSLVVREPELLIASDSSQLDLRAQTASEVVFAVGWPP